MSDPDLGGLGPFPFKDCPGCEHRWPLASFRNNDLCFRCMSGQPGELVMARKRREPLVRYLSPFGTPAWMPRERALALLEDDDRRYVKLSQAGVLSYCVLGVESSHCDGPPHIQSP